MDDILIRWLQQWHLTDAGWNGAIIFLTLLAGALITGLLWLLGHFQSKEQKGFFLFHSAVHHLAAPLNVFFPLFLLNLLRPDMRMTVAACIIGLLTIGAVLLTFSSMRKVGTGLLTGVGIGGIIIGIAAQRSLANLLAGFPIAFTQPVRIDDEVVVEGQFGKIEEITLTYIVVKIWDERRLVLPITYFLEKPFENWTRTTADTMGTVFFFVDYTVPIETVRAEFTRFVQQHPLWDGRSVALIVSDLKPEVMELRGLVSGRSSGEVFDLRCAVREAMIRFISDNFPQALPQRRWAPAPRENVQDRELPRL